MGEKKKGFSSVPWPGYSIGFFNNAETAFAKIFVTMLWGESSGERTELVLGQLELVLGYLELVLGQLELFLFMFMNMKSKEIRELNFRIPLFHVIPECHKFSTALLSFTEDFLTEYPNNSNFCLDYTRISYHWQLSHSYFRPQPSVGSQHLFCI